MEGTRRNELRTSITGEIVFIPKIVIVFLSLSFHSFANSLATTESTNDYLAVSNDEGTFLLYPFFPFHISGLKHLRMSHSTSFFHPLPFHLLFYAP